MFAGADLRSVPIAYFSIFLLTLSATIIFNSLPICPAALVFSCARRMR